MSLTRSRHRADPGHDEVAPTARTRWGPQSACEQRDSASRGARHTGKDTDRRQRPPGAFECADPELVVRDVGPDVLGLVEYAVDLGLDAADRLSQVPHLLIHLGAADVHA